jgi:hypothetical protein
MSEEGRELLSTADAQISELIELFSGADDGLLARPCSARAKLGDGTIGAVAWHTAENYGRIARFLEGQPDRGHADEGRARAITRPALLELLARSRDSLRLLGTVSKERLETVPAAGSMRFCDGKRTLHQVVIGLLTHQAHNVETLNAAAR